MKEEEARPVAVVKAFELAEKKTQELNTKLIEAKRDKKSTEVALNEAGKQAEVQCKQLHQVEDELSMAKSHIKVLTKKLEKAKKAKDQAKQDGYEAEVAEIEEALKAEVSEVCRYYCLQVWNKALNQAGVEATSAFRRAESVYYPPAIRAPSSSDPKVDTASKEADTSKERSAKVLPSFGSSFKEAEQLEVVKKEADTTREVAHDVTQPLIVPNDPLKEQKAPHTMELVLETLHVPTKEDLKGKGPASTTTAPA